MKQYSVKGLSKLAGVSIRTLHHYDSLGLLKPSSRSEAGYRVYGEHELLRLQQILFYKELDFPLQEIMAILDDPAFDVLTALSNHRKLLKAKKLRLITLMSTINKTIDHLKNENMMLKPEELYQGFSKETGQTYRLQAIEKYGKEAVDTSENQLRKYNKEQFTQLKQEQETIASALAALQAEDPMSVKVQKLIASHYENIRKFWGTSDTADKQAEAYEGLGQLYVNDDRFTMKDGKAQPEFASFLSKAMSHFARTILK